MMRRFLLTVFLLAAGPAAADSFRVSDVRRGDVLSIRERPDAAAAVIERIPWNARGIRGFGCTNETPSGRTWCRVKYHDVVGWARRRYLQPE